MDKLLEQLENEYFTLKHNRAGWHAGNDRRFTKPFNTPVEAVNNWLAIKNQPNARQKRFDNFVRRAAEIDNS